MALTNNKRSYWAADTSEQLWEHTLSSLLRHNAEQHPLRIALVEPSPSVAKPELRREWTYQALVSDVEQLAQYLLSEFSVGDHIAIYAPNSAEWILLQHAISMAGMVLIAINPAYKQAELLLILENAHCQGIIHCDEYRGVEFTPLLAQIKATALPAITSFTIEQLFDLAKANTHTQVFPNISCDDIIQIQYTSGTTGTPKGAELHHKGVINTARFVAGRANFPEGGVCVNAMPMFHIGGSAVTHMGTLAKAGTYVIVPQFSPESMLRLLEEERGNATLIVPTMIQALLDHPNFSNTDLSAMKTILSGAAAVPAALVTQAKQAFDCDLTILFGQTELNGVVTQTRVNDSLDDQTLTLGQPMPQSEVCIMDTDSGEIVAIGERGEICVRGYQLMKGYHGLPEETAATITPEGWLKTGDMGIMDTRGYVSIAGRIKDMVIRGGMNIYPREIEDRLFEHPTVNQAAVIGLPNKEWGETVAAIVIAEDPVKPPNPEQLFTFCREHMASHKAPVTWFFVDSFPLTPSGKVQKFVLADWVAEGTIQPTQWKKPSKNASAKT